mmetsp:Transcript_10035/g.13779  ORF Transcript_10035/g.13779 Transcript_10035/m.13779 type:complete len:376 (-) Transcript_10035:54-1181(-)
MSSKRTSQEEQASLLSDRMDDERLVNASPTIAQIPNTNNNSTAPKQPPADDDEVEEELAYQAETVLTIMKPVCITMIFVVWAVKTVNIAQTGSSSAGFMVYNESDDDSTGTKLLGSLLNAIIFLIAILVTTVLFVILFKYRCYKIIYGWLILSSLMMLGMFGGVFFFLLLSAYNLAADWLTFAFALWNFSVVGITAVFWHAPTKVNQGYLVMISALMAIFFTRLPDWTTFSILAIVAIYDLFAVLCPKGPLKVLVETAQERKEPIPALIYNAAVFLMMADKPPEERRKGVKLGLGDFVFYSVLIGRAALFDMITVFSCFIAIITGLFFTLLLLAILRKALPALPISIGLGLMFYFLTRIFLLPFVITIGKTQVFV